MVRLSREIVVYLTAEYGAREVLRRLSDPFWFQAFGCVLGFDWHSSGVTTTVCGAVKEGVRGLEHELGLKSGIDRSERVAALKRLVKFGEERLRQRGVTRSNVPDE